MCAFSGGTALDELEAKNASVGEMLRVDGKFAFLENIPIVPPKIEIFLAYDGRALSQPRFSK